LVVVFVTIPAYDGSSMKKMGELLHNNIMPMVALHGSISAG